MKEIFVKQQEKSQNNNLTLVKRILNLGKEHIMNPGKVREYACVMVSKLITRRDVIALGETKTFLEQMAKLYTSVATE